MAEVMADFAVPLDLPELILGGGLGAGGGRRPGGDGGELLDTEEGVRHRAPHGDRVAEEPGEREVDLGARDNAPAAVRRGAALGEEARLGGGERTGPREEEDRHGGSGVSLDSNRAEEAPAGACAPGVVERWGGRYGRPVRPPPRRTPVR